VALSPDRLLWTQSGQDLLAYSADQVNAANAYPAGPIRAVRRLAGAAPEQYTGAAFVDGRLFVASQSGTLMQLWSIDLTSGARTLEYEQRLNAESEGLAAFAGAGGTLH